ncbi:hydrogenase 3 maturation endopeptidase HyCI [Campylobacter fetus]|uniref:Hydrogenase maturation protease n=1 Tax=Campylobacter fetus subsp. testudinum TaxID=1507806 RepID=A0AAX0HA02_CAMFE|nr:hydrogenase 3 maturation endopeptidase HyCI [Campylobacter fetus]ALV64118.1 hydrogenase maturation protease [Campylobacter fetus subsp. testudinum Sp3]OCR85216.1 hydrogenase maturation protease [Campylobacter fetus subsp. testudinum]OCR90402.1 hydrogenase maturation protease [Campylobacter fetus subsp. testudinum]OCR98000.1 hydrogenase maturation protease [Campylobacter fetus subsp. testudinum]
MQETKKEFKKALLCIGNKMRGDDAVGLYVGELVEEQISSWRVFYGQDVPENEFGALREFDPDIIVVVDAMSGFKDDKIEFFDLSDERDYIYSTHNLPTPVLLSYLRTITPKTLFLGISVLLENVLGFEEGLSKNAKISANKAIEKIKEIDKNLD